MLNNRQTYDIETFVPSRNKKQKFNPNREYVEQAVGEYLNSGGKIEHVTTNFDDFEMSPTVGFGKILSDNFDSEDWY